MRALWQAFLHLFPCLFGWHQWDQNVPEEDRWLIKHAGMDVLFSSSGVQKAVQHCKHCTASRMVYRQGWVNAGLGPTGVTPWKYCPPNVERKIDALPPL